MINRICGSGDRYTILEHFKSHFAAASGSPHHHSSSESWASSDLDNLIQAASTNAPVFIEAFYSACEQLSRKYPGMALPDVAHLNRILMARGCEYRLEPPNLVLSNPQQPIAGPATMPSLDLQARALIDSALQNSQAFLEQGNGRQAVQEILWLLETVATAFRGPDVLEGSIQGRYFNKIVVELKQQGRGTPQEQILSWMTALHGYLSSPTGGGIRHGMDLRDGVGLQLGEARLYCNLIRSYITYLISEHERLSRRP